MKLEARTEGEVRILALDGRFDAHEAPAVTTWIAAGLDRPGAERVVIDLAGVTFVDSTALATLVQGMKRCRERSGDLVLANLRQAVRIIFELTNLDKAFAIYPGDAEAIRSFHGGTPR